MAGKNGGARPGAGRKPKSDEVKLVERLTPLADSAFRALRIGVEAQEPIFVKMWFEYMYGKPKQTVDTNVTVSEPVIIEWEAK